MLTEKSSRSLSAVEPELRIQENFFNPEKKDDTSAFLSTLKLRLAMFQ
jgi:hypothetical protein